MMPFLPIDVNESVQNNFSTTQKQGKPTFQNEKISALSWIYFDNGHAAEFQGIFKVLSRKKFS